MQEIRIFAVLLLIALFITCCSQNGNPVAPQNPIIWDQEQMRTMRVPGVCANAGIIIAGAYRSYSSNVLICRSTDDGLTWLETDSILVSNHSPGQALWIIPSVTFFADGPFILGGIGGGMERGDVFISWDNGLSWSRNGTSWPETGNNGEENINCFCAIGEEIFAGTDNGVFVSKDKGVSWTPANTGLSFQVMRLATIGPYLFAGTTGEGIYISSDNGATWNTVSGGSVTDIYGLATIGTNLFAGESFRKGIFRSTDMGGSWVGANNGLTNLSINTLISNGSNLYAGTNSGIFLSTNEGSSWTFVSNGSIEDSNAVLSIAINNSSLVSGTTNGVNRYLLSNLTQIWKGSPQTALRQKGG